MKDVFKEIIIPKFLSEGNEERIEKELLEFIIHYAEIKEVKFSETRHFYESADMLPNWVLFQVRVGGD